jgi:hypothetical protein
VITPAFASRISMSADRLTVACGVSGLRDDQLVLIGRHRREREAAVAVGQGRDGARPV